MRNRKRIIESNITISMIPKSDENGRKEEKKTNGDELFSSLRAVDCSKSVTLKVRNQFSTVGDKWLGLS